MEKLPGFTAESSLSKTNGNYALGMKSDGYDSKPGILPQIGCGPCEQYPDGWFQYCCFGFDKCLRISCPPPPCPGGWECDDGRCCAECRATNPFARCCRSLGEGLKQCEIVNQAILIWFDDYYPRCRQNIIVQNLTHVHNRFGLFMFMHNADIYRPLSFRPPTSHLS